MTENTVAVLTPAVIGHQTPKFDVEVEKGRLRLFAKAIGERNPIYFDEAAAIAAGYASIPVPPTFFFCLEMERDEPYDWFHTLGIPLPKVLHGEQNFTYHSTACAGDILSFRGEVMDVYAKKGGALEFFVHRNFVSAHDGTPVAEFDRTLVIRHD